MRNLMKVKGCFNYATLGDFSQVPIVPYPYTGFSVHVGVFATYFLLFLRICDTLTKKYSSILRVKYTLLRSLGNLTFAPYASVDI